MILVGGQDSGGGAAIYGLTTVGGNVGAGLTDLATFVVTPAMLARAGDWLEIHWAALMAANGTVKLTSISFGASAIAARSIADNNVLRWHTVLLTRLSATLQVSTSIISTNGAAPVLAAVYPAENLAANVSIVFRAQGTANNDVVNTQIQIRRGSAPALYNA